MRIAPGGIQWISAGVIFFIIISVSCFILDGVVRYFCVFLSAVLLFLVILLLIFFRDPERQIGDGIIAVADGKIRDIYECSQNGAKWVCVSTFMNIHNVHVNRMPLDGQIKKLKYFPGGYLPAYRKESDRNERLEIMAKTDIGNIKIVLIAGALARRIVPYIKEGDVLAQGTRIGLIRLGSRVDLYLPTSSVTIKISINDRIRAGVDTIATVNA